MKYTFHLQSQQAALVRDVATAGKREDGPACILNKFGLDMPAHFHVAVRQRGPGTSGAA